MQTTAFFYVLHVLFAVAAIGLLVVPGLMLDMVAHTRDVPLIRRMYQLGSFHGKIGGPLAVLTALVGLIAAWRMGIPLNTGWLVAGYIAFALILAIGFGYFMRRELTIGALALTSPDAAPSPELDDVIRDPWSTPMFWTSGLLWAFLIWVMTARPF